jgi:hypothetical protein
MSTESYLTCKLYDKMQSKSHETIPLTAWNDFIYLETIQLARAGRVVGGEVAIRGIHSPDPGEQGKDKIY